MEKFPKETIQLPKILAPAGSFETLEAAINAGADEIYFGIADFNMRATAAANFKTEDLEEVVKRCKVKGVKTNLTINTVLYDGEIERMKEIVDLAKLKGVDSVIAADMATIAYAHSVGLEVHISTQVSISNFETVKFYSQFADRIVLARELNLEQVAEIVRKIHETNLKGPAGKLVEIEVFAHGALCVAVSGRCAMSLYCSNSSANRGKCSHMCRRAYKVTDISTGKELVVDNNFVMSSADLCTIGMIPELVDAGVYILKIEGRGRPPEYVDTVVKTYKESLDSISKGEYSPEKVNQWNKVLKTVFNRGFTQNFYMGQPISAWAGVHGNKATEEKALVGKVMHYFPEAEVAEIQIQGGYDVKVTDKYSITGETTGIVIGEIGDIRVEDKSAKSASKGEIFTMKVPGKVRKNDKFYLITKRTSTIPRGREKFYETKDFCETKE